jgi:hypothetical protein
MVRSSLLLSSSSILDAGVLACWRAGVRKVEGEVCGRQLKKLASTYLICISGTPQLAKSP